MHKTQIAEMILSLFTTRERAASTVGDLIENAADRGAWGFWPGVARTASSLLWRTFTAESGFLVALGFRGVIFNLFLCVLVFFAMLIFGAFFFGFIAGVNALGSTPGDVSAEFLKVGWIFRLMGSIAIFAVEFRTGQWIARRARDKEIAACVSFLIVQEMVMLAIGEIISAQKWFGEFTSAAPSVPNLEFGPPATAVIILSTIALFAGAVAVRRRVIRTT